MISMRRIISLAVTLALTLAGFGAVAGVRVNTHPAWVFLRMPP